MPYIISRVFGGLGNQMFIYAFSRALSLALGVELRVDSTSGYKKDRYKRQYLLNKYNINAKYANSWDMYHHVGGSVRRVIDKSLRKNSYYFIDDKMIKPHLLPLIKNKIYLDGYWQSEKHFIDYRNVLINELNYSLELSTVCKDTAYDIRNSNSVCVHFRSFKEVSGKISSIPIEYYNNAVNQATKLIENPHYYCFSDFPSFFKKQATVFNSKNSTFVDIEKYGTKNANCEELYLMTKCKYHIISNSTFSWWGAWLSTFDGKLVFCPSNSIPMHGSTTIKL